MVDAQENYKNLFIALEYAYKIGWIPCAAGSFVDGEDKFIALVWSDKESYADIEFHDDGDIFVSSRQRGQNPIVWEADNIVSAINKARLIFDGGSPT